MLITLQRFELYIFHSCSFYHECKSELHTSIHFAREHTKGGWAVITSMLRGCPRSYMERQTYNTLHPTSDDCRSRVECVIILSPRASAMSTIGVWFSIIITACSSGTAQCRECE